MASLDTGSQMAIFVTLELLGLANCSERKKGLNYFYGSDLSPNIRLFLICS